MGCKAPILAVVTEAAAGDIEAASSGRDCGEKKNHRQACQDRQCAAVDAAENQRESAENLQPRQIKSHRDTAKPWDDFVIVDVHREAGGIERLEQAGINEHAADQKIDNAPKNV